MEVSREKLAELLELQKIDSTIDRLEARRRALPEQAELDELERGLGELEHSIGEQQAVVDEIAVRQRKLDSDIEIVRTKIDTDDGKLNSGKFTNPRELADLQREVESLKRRQANLEDQDLEVMEEREQAEGVLTPIIEEFGRLRVAAEEATKRRDEAAGDVQTELVQAGEERERWAPKFDEELLSLYDRLRASKGGVGAAALVGGVCQGCHMTLPKQEYERVRKAEGMVFCEECRRILVVM